MPRRISTLLAVAALLSGVLLAWALPALAGTGGHGRVARAAATGTRTTSSPTATSQATPTGTVASGPAPTTGSSTSTTTSTPSGTGGTKGSTGSEGTPGSTGSKGRAATAPANWVGSWSRPFTVTGAVGSDLIPPVLAVSATGKLAVGSGLTNEDAPNTAKANIVTATAADLVGAHSLLSGVQQTLAVGYLGDRRVLVTGTSPGTDACCSSASTLAASGTRFGSSQELAAGLQGASVGALVPVRGGLLAAVDNQSGITVARSGATGSFGAAEQLVGADPTPPLMAVGSLAGGGAVVAWTAPVAGAAQTVTGTTTAPGSSSTASGYDQPANQLIYFATSGPTGLPGAPKLAVTVPAGREIDALTVAENRTGATAAWAESWYVGYRYLSEVFWADLGPSPQVTALSGGSTAAVGLSMAGSSDGRQVLTWQACDVSSGTCTADAALRPHGYGWGPVRTLGPVDPSSFPVAAQSRLGQSLVGWTDDGSIIARSARPGSIGFYRPVTIASASADSNLALGFGSASAGAGESAAAVWVQGTVDQKLVGARFTP